MANRPAHQRPVWLTLAVAVVTAVAGCSGLSFAQEGPPGAIPSPPAHGYGGIVVEVGAPFTDAFENIQNHGTDPVTITGFELINTSWEVELVDVLIAGDEREANFQWEPNFPPQQHDMGPLAPAVGAVLLPVSQQSPDMGGYSLIIGMRVTEPGKWMRGGYRIEFTQGSESYLRDVVAEITICTPEYVAATLECDMRIP